MKKLKQISYLSALIIIIGSTVGAGIFFKNKELFGQAQGNLYLVITSWCISGIGMIALGVAIIELTSVSKTNAGSLEWFKNFLPNWIFVSSKKYVQIIFGPITMFTMTIYIVKTLQDSGMPLEGGTALIVAFSIFMWLALISLFSLKGSEKLQWLLAGLKFIPIIIIPLASFYCIGDISSSTEKDPSNIEIKKGLLGIAPAIIIIGGIPAITFAFDGFYEVASLRNDLKRPKKLGPILTLGISLILAIYIFITIALAIGSKDGTINGLSLNSKFLDTMNIMIGVGIISIVNGHMMGCVEQNASLYEEGESPVLVWIKKLLKFLRCKKITSRIISWVYMLISTIVCFIVFGLIGIYGWNSGGNHYGSVSSLYNFSDILVNYTSSLMFGMLALTIIFCLINRFTKKIKVQKNKFFIPAAIITSIVLIPGILFQFITGIVDSTGYNNASSSDAIVSLIIFVFILFVSIVLSLIENKFWDSQKHKHLAKDTEIQSVVENIKNK